MSEEQTGYYPGQWIIVDGKPRMIQSVTATQISIGTPFWKRVLLVLMRIAGWIILVPAALATLVSGVFVVFSSITWNIANFVIWSIIAAVCSGFTALGVLMTGVMKDKE